MRPPDWFQPSPPRSSGRRARSNPEQPILTPPPELVEDVVQVLREIRRKKKLKGPIHRFEPYGPIEIPRGVTYFASGSNHPGDVQGFADLGFGVGTSAAECPSKVPGRISPCERAYYDLALMSDPPPVFVDSGAYKEFSSRQKAEEAKKEARKSPTKENREKARKAEEKARAAVLPPAKWDSILGMYDRFVSRLAPKTQVYLVAPDKIGDQAETLRRMERSASRIKALSRKGAVVLAPVQRGRLASQLKFWGMIREVLGPNVYAALPMRASATPPGDVLEFVRKARGLRGLHLLGMGPRSTDVPDVSTFLGEVMRSGRGVKLSMDSSLGRAAFGWGDAKKGKFDPKEWTYAQQIAGLMLEQELGDEAGVESLRMWTKDHGWASFDFTDEIGFPNDWLTEDQKRELVKRMDLVFGLSRSEAAALKKDPGSFLNSSFRGGSVDWWDLEWTYQILRELWWSMVQAYAKAGEAANRRRYGIHYAFARAAAGAGGDLSRVEKLWIAPAGGQLERDGVRDPGGIEWRGGSGQLCFFQRSC